MEETIFTKRKPDIKIVIPPSKFCEFSDIAVKNPNEVGFFIVVVVKELDKLSQNSYRKMNSQENFKNIRIYHKAVVIVIIFKVLW
jgi:hypothetical protein